MSSKKTFISNEKNEGDLESENSGRLNGFSEKDLFVGIKEKWQEADLETAPFLADVINKFRDNNEKELEKRLDLRNLSAFPFYHLIPIKKLSADFSALPSSLVRPQTIGEAEKRRQIFWESLAGQDMPANEAALLDDSIWCSFIDFINGEFVEIDWEVLYFDELQGCAEIYCAEMLTFKRRVYEAGSNLRAILELKDIDILKYLPQHQFAIFETEEIQRLFLDNLIAPYSLTMSKSGELANRIEKIASKAKKLKKLAYFADIFDTYTTYSANRMESWTSMETINNGVASLSIPGNKPLDNLNNNSKLPTELSENSNKETKHTCYRLRLTKYWLNWQKDALTAGLDFSFIETLDNARLIRF